MSYNQTEKSLDSRQPVRLYEFSYGAFKYAYNTSAINITWNNQVFKSLLGGVSDNGIIRSDGGNSDAFQVIAPRTIEVAALYEGVAPTKPVILKVYDSHLGESEAIQVWQGEIVTMNFSAIDRVKITAIPSESATNKLGATLGYTRQCSARLYDKKCKVNRELYKLTGSILQLDLRAIQVIQAATKQDSWFTGGYIEYGIGSGELEVRGIEKHEGDTLTLLGGTSGLKVGLEINFYAGCNLIPDTCINKFNNILNFRGTPYLKGKSLFDGTPVGW